MDLLINTTENKAQLVLARNDQILDQKIFEAALLHSERLLPEISKLLKKNKAGLGDLKTIIVITGPGSYTGCRVGVATANALVFALEIPVIGISKNEIKKKDFFAKKAILRVIKTAKKKIKSKLAAPFYERPPHITRPKPIL